MIKLKDLLKENPKDFVDKNIDSKELLYRKKKYYIEAAKIKKVKNVSVQYMDAEYQGETLHGFKYFRKGPWLYKKDNGEYFAVVITNKGNKYEIQLGNKPKNNIQATAAVEKIIKKNLNKFESVNEGMNKRQAGEMLKQLGGNRFIMMTGAKNFGVGPKGAGFKIGRNSKGVNFVRIDLKNDLYNMEFIQLRKKRGSMDVNMKVLKRVKGVYADQLQSVFTKHTGMYTSL